MSLYGNILDLAMVEVPTEAIETLIQYYDPPLRSIEVFYLQKFLASAYY